MSRSRTHTLIPDHFDTLPAIERRDIEISAASQSPQEDRAGVRIILLEKFECCKCDSTVPNEMVVGHILPFGENQRPRRKITAYCEHCDLLYEVTTELRGAIWQATGHATVISNARAKRSHFAAVQARLGASKRQAC